MEMLQPLAAIGFVLSLLAAMLWWLSRRGYVTPAAGRRAGKRRLECLERLPLAPQHTLHLVRIGDTALLLASGPRGCAVVRSMPVGEIEAAGGGSR
jgi:flagellar biogenesis protein FliO